MVGAGGAAEDAATDAGSVVDGEGGVDKLSSEQPTRARQTSRAAARDCLNTINNYRNTT
ncbi:hypothetical protein GCM10027580_16700 [Corynebacterium faecale]